MIIELTTQDASYCFPNFGRRNALKKERKIRKDQKAREERRTDQISDDTSLIYR